MHQGRCTLPADEAGRIMDRLTGLEKIIRPEDIQQALAATGRVNSRRCRLTHEVTMWVVLAIGLFTDCRSARSSSIARRLRRGEDSPHRSSLCFARQRLGVAPVRQLFAQVVHPLAQPQAPGAFYRGWRLMGIDGTSSMSPTRMPTRPPSHAPPRANGARVSPNPQAELGRVGIPSEVGIDGGDPRCPRPGC